MNSSLYLRWSIKNWLSFMTGRRLWFLKFMHQRSHCTDDQYLLADVTWYCPSSNSVCWRINFSTAYHYVNTSFALLHQVFLQQQTICCAMLYFPINLTNWLNVIRSVLFACQLTVQTTSLDTHLPVLKADFWEELCNGFSTNGVALDTLH